MNDHVHVYACVLKENLKEINRLRYVCRYIDICMYVHTHIHSEGDLIQETTIIFLREIISIMSSMPLNYQ